MGNVFSSVATRGGEANATSESNIINEASNTADMANEEEERLQEQLEDEAHAKAKNEEMTEFRKQLSIKREQRREILARHRTEKDELEKSLQAERVAKVELYENNRKLRDLLIMNNIEIPDNIQTSNENSELTEAVAHMSEEFEKLKELNNKLRRDLVDSNTALQTANSAIADMHSENRESFKQINALKEVVTVSKTMINLREEQLNALKNKLNEIERTLGDRETNLLSADLRKEYAKQLQNIRTLRGLYEERARLAEVTRQGLVRELDEQKRLYQAEVNKSTNFTSQIEELESKVAALQEIIENKNIEISTCRDESNGLKAEMKVVNKLFSQVLLGYKTKQDLDKLVHRLEENHGILTHMAEQENGSEASSALPKLLLELVSQVEENEDEMHKNETNEPTQLELSDNQNPKNTTPEEIVENLPKVWKVLIELLSHQNVPEEESSEKVTTCYKSVETKSGPVLVPSVSQTYIRLKDLIIEKLGLVKEVNRMKQLNSHLESRLEVQERRLCLVTTELSKTWHVVSRLRRHHHQLHTHEKILKYELQQKRKLLNELKEELEYCREKLEQAREKNTQSEKDWRNLRAEFASRKTKSDSASLNNSAESGYSDERPSDESSESNDEREHVSKSSLRCKKKHKQSFETIMDSSADFNLVAEREDPASDMLDVADLPLDTQDGDNNQGTTSDGYKYQTPLKTDKPHDATEDELCDITHDNSSPEESLNEQNCDAVKNTDLISDLKTNISEEISEHQEKKESVNETTFSDFNEKPTSSCSNQVNMENNKTDDLNTIDDIKDDDSKLDECITLDNNLSIKSVEESHNIDSTSEIFENNEHDNNTVNENEKARDINKNVCSIDSSDNEQSNEIENEDNCKSTLIDFKKILENVKQQNERLSKKDERLQNLEVYGSDLVKTLSNTISTGGEISEKLDILHIKHQTSQIADENESVHNTDENISNEVNGLINESTEPSTSSENNHEARFAARDLRLKRLEEQTKSLVNRVNKTTSKGVKINYKLEELHSIYGSESSRAGTPSEDNEDKSIESETNHDSD